MSSLKISNPPSLFSLTLFLQSETISCRSVKLTPPRLLRLALLSLIGDSLTILCCRSNRDLQGSLPGAPFNCLVRAAASRGWNDSAWILSLSLFRFYLFLGLLSFPFHACSPSHSIILLTVAGSLCPVRRGLLTQGRLLSLRYTHLASVYLRAPKN